MCVRKGASSDCDVSRSDSAPALPNEDSVSDTDDDGNGSMSSHSSSAVRASRGLHSASPVRRRVGSVLSMSSALELFGIRAGSSANSALPRRSALQPLGSSAPYTIESDAVAEPASQPHTAVSNGASVPASWRLAQLDARSLPTEDDGSNENAISSAALTATGVASDHPSPPASMLPVARALEDVPVVAAALQEAFSSGYVRKQATKAFLASRTACDSWLPNLFGLFRASAEVNRAVVAAYGSIIRLLLAQDDLLDVLSGEALFPLLLAILEAVLGAPTRSFQESLQRVRFRQAAPLDNADLVAKVHRCFRLSFLRGA
jgi:hypothetical protein